MACGGCGHRYAPLGAPPQLVHRSDRQRFRGGVYRKPAEPTPPPPSVTTPIVQDPIPPSIVTPTEESKIKSE